MMRFLCPAALCVFLLPLRAETIDAGYRQMYNLEFPAAHVTFEAWQKQNPADPLGPVSDAAAYLFSELDRLRILQSEFFADQNKFFDSDLGPPDPQIKSRFEAALKKALDLADARLKKSPADLDAKFVIVLAHGLRSDYLGLVEKSYISSLNELKLGRMAADQLLMARPDYYDAYLAVGVENYLLSLKPAPVRWLLRMSGAQTDRKMGVEKLKLTADSGNYLKPFARLLLAVAAIREKDLPKARELLTWLTTEFPRNRLYREELQKIK
jgi:hypothetical protein